MNYNNNESSNTQQPIFQQEGLMGHAQRRCPFENLLVDDSSNNNLKQVEKTISLRKSAKVVTLLNFADKNYKKNNKTFAHECFVQIQGLVEQREKNKKNKKNKQYVVFIEDLIEQKNTKLFRTLKLKQARIAKGERLDTVFQGLFGPIGLDIQPISEETFDSFERLFDHLSAKLKTEFSKFAYNSAITFGSIVAIACGIYLAIKFATGVVIKPLWSGFCTAIRLLVPNMDTKTAKFLSHFWGEGETQTQGYAEKNLVPLFALLASFATVSKVDFASLMKVVANFKKTSENFKNFSDFIVETWNHAVKCVKYYILGDAKAFDLANDVDGVDRWLQEIADWQIKLDTKSLLFTSKNYEAIQSLVVKGRMLTKAYALCSRDYDNVKTAVKMGNDSLSKIMNAFAESPFDKCRIRPKPLTILFKGSSGVGKSAMTVPFLDALLLRTFNTQEERDRYAQNNMDFIYSRAAEQEYWDGYFGQKAVVLDDFMQADETKVNNGLVNEAFELIRASNQFPYPMHKAHLEDKGNCYFESRIIMATTNNWNIKSQVIVEQEALVRRFDLIAEVYPKEEFCRPETLGGTMKDRRLKKLNGFTTDVYEFVVTVGCASILTLDFEGMVQLAVQTYRELDQNGYTYLDAVTRMREKERQKLDDEEVFFDAEKELSNMVEKIRSGEMSFEEPQSDDEAPSTMQQGLHTRVSMKVTALKIKRMLPDSCSLSFDLIEKTLIKLEDKYGLTYCGYKPFVGMVHRIATLDPTLPHSVRLEYLYTREYTYLLNAQPWFLMDITDEIQRLEMEQFMAEFEYKPTTSQGLAVCVDCDDEPWEQTVTQGLEECAIQAEVERAFSETSSSSGRAEYDLSTKDPKVRDACYGFLKEFYAEKEEHEKETTLTETIRAKFGILRLKVRESIDLIKQRIMDLDDKYPWLSWLSLMIGIICATAGLYYAFRPREEGTDEQSLKFHKTVTSRGKSKVDKIRMLRDIKMAMRQQGPSVNERVEKMSDSIMTKNMYVLVNPAGQKIGSVLAIGGSDFLINAHYKRVFSTYERNDEERDILMVPLSCWVSNMTNGAVALPVTFFKDRELTPLEKEKDLMVFNLGNATRPCREIASNFISEDLLSSYGDTLPLHVSLVREQEGRPSVVTHLTNNKKILIATSRGKREEYVYNIPTYHGECGSISILNDGNANPKLVGIHCEGDGVSRGFPAVVTKELLEELRNPMRKQGLDDEWSSDEEPQQVYLGHMVIRTLDKAPHLPRKTKLRKSVVHGCFGPSLKAPAALKVVDGIDPFDLAIERYATINKFVVPWKVEAARKQYCDQLQALGTSSKKILSYEEAVEGIAGNKYVNGIPRKTSAGYPLCLQTQRGKKDIFGDDGPYQYGSELEKAVRASVDDLVNACHRGEDREILYMDILKDELRPLQKVSELKTRMISCAPLHYVIAVRMFFGSFCAFMMENRVFSGSAVGVNPFSNDWGTMVRYLKGVGENMVAGDFSSFDASQSSQMMDACLWIINRWYSDGHDKVREMLFRDCTFSKHVHGVYVLGWTHCLPSGHPLTSICNTMFVNLAFRICWISHHGLISSISAFAEHCRIVAYGDDHVLAMSDSARDSGFGYTSITKYMKVLGLKYTDENKSAVYDVESKDISECSFLKRGFFFVDGTWIAPLDLETILEMPYWYRNGPDVSRRMVDNIENCLRELAIHGDDVFDVYSTILLNAAYEHKDILPMSFEPYPREYYVELAYGSWCDSEGDGDSDCFDADAVVVPSHGKPPDEVDRGYANRDGLTC